MSSNLAHRAHLASGFLACLTLACGATRSWSSTPRPVAALPEQFVVDGPVPAGTGRTCMVHLKAPDCDARLTLVRSSDNGSEGIVGDYRIEPAGRYGIAADEPLRVDCLTGHPSGAVRGPG